MPTISSTSNLNSTTPGVIPGTPGAKKNDNPFLDLLVAEMRTQTPLKPVDNDSFMQQMASYSSMTEQKTLNDNLVKLLDFQGALARLQGLSQSSSLLGKKVTFVDADEPTKTASGIVDSVFVDEQGTVKLKIGDKQIGLGQVVGVENGNDESGKNASKS